jgi:hypothetical protein
MGQRKVTTELTSKRIKSALLIFGLGFWLCLLAIPFDIGDWGLWATASCISLLGYFFAKIARWWENE